MGQITYFFPQSIFYIANIQILNDSIKYYDKNFAIGIDFLLYVV